MRCYITLLLLSYIEINMYNQINRMNKKIRELRKATNARLRKDIALQWTVNSDIVNKLCKFLFIYSQLV